MEEQENKIKEGTSVDRESNNKKWSHNYKTHDI